MKVLWTSAALRDRLAIWDYIAAENPQAAERMYQLFRLAPEQLKDNPLSGRPGSVDGTRELFPHENYRLVYEVHGDTVWILALVHTARLWPPPQETQ